MSIDARVKEVVLNEDGSGELVLVDRPKRRPGDVDGCRGQSSLRFDRSPPAVKSLEGADVWGGSESLILGDRVIATRRGYTRIEFVSDEKFRNALCL
jgi:hypothetical protein